MKLVSHSDADAARRQELSRFLRARRAALQPEQFGFLRRPRRRVPGLLRYEVAELAGVSDTWYTWLEQGRDVRVSASALDAVSRAMQLDTYAHEHLRRLAALPVDPIPMSSEPTDALSGLVDDQMPSPACLITASFDILRWNRMYAVIFGDPGQVPPEHRNALRSLLMNPNIRELMDDWTDEVSGVVARFGFENGKYPGDPTFAALITEMTSNSRQFRELWKRASVRPYVGRDLVINHRDHGTLELTKIQLRPVDRPSLMLNVFRPCNGATREALNNLMELRGERGSTDHQDQLVETASVATTAS